LFGKRTRAKFIQLITTKISMKETIIKMMAESRQNLLQTLKEDSEILENDEIDQMLDSLLEIEKILKTLKED
jgi:hypothetical protein